MSRDFELLQRVEQEQIRRPHLRTQPADRMRSARPDAGTDAAHEQVTAAVHPAAHLTAVARNELSKLVLATFFSTPPAKVVIFAGVEAHEGAKCIAACSADILSSASRDRVCVVDADLSMPTIHRYFAIANHTGLASMLEGTSPAARCSTRIAENLWVIPAGTPVDNSYCTAARFKECTLELQGLYDYIVYAVADCTRYAEMIACGAAAEGVVLVLDAEKTRRVSAQQAKEALDSAKIHIIGSVFNNQDVSIPEFLSNRI